MEKSVLKFTLLGVIFAFCFPLSTVCVYVASDFFCGFETTNLCGFTNEQSGGDSYDWSQDSQGTGTQSTGPPYAYTGTYYVLAEAKDQSQGDTAIILTPSLIANSSVSSQTLLVFWYNMYGEAMGTLNVYLVEQITDTTNTTSLLLTQSGNKGDDNWYMAEVYFTTDSTTKFKIGFEAIRGSDITGDICIDHVEFLTTPSEFYCGFEDGLCGLYLDDDEEDPDNFYWQISAANSGTPDTNTGPSGPYDGSYYIYTEASGTSTGATALLITPRISASGCATLNFTYSMYGSGIGSLNVYAVDNITQLGNSEYLIFSRSGNIGDDKWYNNVSTIPFDLTEVRVIFEAIKGDNGKLSDFALDEIRISGCNAESSSPISTVGSCLGNCGNNASDCYCDSICTSQEDCCSDYLTFCSAESSTPITPTAAIPTGLGPVTTQNENHPTTLLMTTTGSCSGNCGNVPEGSDCSCESSCGITAIAMECCSDYFTLCSAESSTPINEADNTCESNEYVCKDNECIPSEYKCDSIIDCEDGDDENDCFYDIYLEISCSHNCDYDHVNPNDTLIMGTICKECTKASIIWIIKLYDGGKWFTLDEESTKTGLASADLALKSGMREGTTYHVEVQVSDGYGYGRGNNSLNFTTTSPPYGGTCQSSDEEGEAINDEFTFNCSGWRTDVEGGKLGYNFYYQIRGSEDVNLLPTTATATSEGNFLPNGNSIYDYAIDIIINIFDQYQSTTEYTFKIKVSEATFSKDTLNQYTTSVSGDISSALSQKNIVMDLVNGDTEKGDGGQLSISERKELRESMATSILTASSNLTGSGQISQSISLIKAITKEPEEMSTTAMEVSASVLRNAAESLKDVSGETTETILDIAQNVVDGVGNLLKATLLSEGSSDNTVANSLTEAFEDLTTTVAGTMSPGEETEINTDSVKIKVGKNRKQDMGDKTVSSSSGSNVKLPSADTLFGSGDDSAVISNKLVGFENIPYVDSSSDQLNGESLSFSFEFENGTAIILNDLPDIIVIQIPNPGSSTDPLDSVSTNKVDDDNYLYVISALVFTGESLVLKMLDIQSCQLGSNVSIFILDNATNPSLDNQTYTDSQGCPEGGGNISFVIAKENFNTSGVKNTTTVYLGVVQKEPIEMKIQSFTAQCKVWNTTGQQWTEDGLSVMSDSTPNLTYCGTNHLSTFASGASFYPPEPINWADVLSGFQNLSDNAAVFSMIFVILGLYLAIIYFAWKADNADNEKWSATILNTTQGENAYHYHLYVNTGVMGGADTCSKVFIILTGSKGNSEVICLNDGNIKERMIFSRGSVRQFLIAIPQSLGVLQTLRVWHDNSGILDKRSWYLSRMTVVDDEKQERYHFVCESWLALEKDDGRIERLLRIASESDLKKVKPMLSTNAYFNLTDGHLWFSVVSRPRRSTFTRVQRISCCLSLLYCTMVANCMWYQQTKQQGNDVSINIGPIQLSWKSIQIGFMSSLVVLPVNLIIIQLFRKSSATPKTTKCCSCSTGNSSKCKEDLSPECRQVVQAENLTVEEEIELELKKLDNKEYKETENRNIEASNKVIKSLTGKEHNFEGQTNTINEEHRIDAVNDEQIVEGPSLMLTRQNKSSNGLSYEHNHLKEKGQLPQSNLSYEREEITNKILQTILEKSDENTEGANYTHQRSKITVENNSHVMEVDKVTQTRIRYKIRPKKNQNKPKRIQSATSKQIQSAASKQIQSATSKQTQKRPSKWSHVQSKILPIWKISGINSKNKRDVEETNEKSDTSQSLGAKKKKTGMMLPYWCKHVAWTLVILTCLVSAAFTVFYSMQWGAEDSNKWLLGFFISFFEDVILIQPIKIIVVALIVTMIFKKYEGEDKEGVQVDVFFSEDMNIDISKETLMTTDVDPEIREKLKIQRKKETEMKIMIKDFVVFLIFLGLLWFIAYGSRDPNAILINNEITDTLFENIPFSEITGNFDYFYTWLRNVLLPNYFVTTYYNGDALKGIELKLFSNLAAYKLGSTRLRQIRAKDVCVPIKKMSNLSSHCTVDYSESNEDTSDYGSQWSPFDPNNTSSYATIWQYKTANELSGLTTFGVLNDYPGGGFVVELGTTSTEANEAVNYIFDNKWLDEFTRALFIEFNLYNPNVNLFSSVKVLLEYPSIGGAVVDTSIDIMQLSGYVGTFWIITLLIDIIFVAFILYYVIKELIVIWKMKLSYFRKFWNIIEVIKIMACIAAAGCFILKSIERVTSLSEIGTKGLNSFTNLQLVVFYNEVYLYMLAFVVFFSTLKIWNLLEFNNLFRSISLTLNVASTEIINFLIMFFLTMFAFGHLLYLAVGSKLYEYHSVWKAVQTLFSMLLGEFDFQGLEASSGILGPIIFFLFSLSVYFTLSLVFITIVLSAFTKVRRDFKNQREKYEVLKYVKDNLKSLLGISPESDEPELFRPNTDIFKYGENHNKDKKMFLENKGVYGFKKNPRVFRRKRQPKKTLGNSALLRKGDLKRPAFPWGGVNVPRPKTNHRTLRLPLSFWLPPKKKEDSHYDEFELMQQRLNTILKRFERIEHENSVVFNIQRKNAKKTAKSITHQKKK